MISQSSLDLIAESLWNASKTGDLCDPVRTKIGEKDLKSAYLIQEINTRKKLALGEHVVGAKIGLTSLAVQKQLGVDQPDFGMLTSSMQVAPGDVIPWNVLHQPKVEAEIAFVLRKPLGHEAPNMEILLDAIDYACASIEIVGSRIKNWDIRITDTIADNASASHFVLGSKRAKLDEFDLEGCQMQMFKDGVEVSSGVGKACLGNPLNAALWLAKTLYELNQPLEAGHVILAGALGPMVPVAPGDRFEASIEGLGRVHVSFGEADK